MEVNQYHIILTEVPNDKEIVVAKTIARLLEMGLKSARQLIYSAPIKLIDGLSVQEANTFRQALEQVGATIVIGDDRDSSYFPMTHDISMEAPDESKVILEAYYNSIIQAYSTYNQLNLAKTKEKDDLIILYNKLDKDMQEKNAKDKNYLESQKIEILQAIEQTHLRIKLIKNSKVLYTIITVFFAVLFAVISKSAEITFIATAIVLGILALVNSVSKKS